MGQVALVAEAQSVQIVENIAEDLVVTVGRKRIERVLVNLFINTLDVMPGGGTIRISAIPERHSVLVKVRDTGPGIDPIIRDRIFQPFATAGKADGLGLGLAFSRQAVLDHGGQMWVESSEPGHLLCVLVYRAVRAWRKYHNPKLRARPSVRSRTRPTGGAVSRDCLSGSSYAKESAILMISSWAR